MSDRASVRMARAASSPDDGRVTPGDAIGRSELRKEDPALLVGSACFVDDLQRSGTVHAAVLRSPHAHARIASLDTAAARALPGVVDVVTAADLPDGLRIPMRMFRLPGMERFLQPPLAEGVVRYSGEPVAVILADSRYVAEDAAELVEVGYEPLAPVIDALDALEPGAPIVHAEAADTNLAGSFVVEFGDIGEAFAAAAVLVEERIRIQRHAAVPMETRGLVAEWNPGGGRLTVWGAAKIIHINRRILAGLLGLPEERIRLVELHVGGGFGARGEFYPEDLLVPWCAMRIGRPVSWTEDREEHLRATNHSRQQTHDIALALDADGRFLGLRDRVANDTGAYVRTHGTVVPGMTAALLPGPYAWDAYRCEIRHVLTTKTPAGTYRAPGRYEATFARERLIDIAAARLGMDPVELRRRNLVQPEQMPYAVGTHTEGHPVVFDSGDYPLMLDRAIERFDLDAARAWRGADVPAHVRRGVGIAFFVEKSGIGRWEYARVQLRSDGGADVHTGIASIGQGVETVLAQICSEYLGVEYEHVEVLHGDTDDVPDGMGSFGSRATMLAGSAVREAAIALRERLLELAADRLEASAADLRIADGRIGVEGSPASGISLRDLYEEARALSALPGGREPGLREEAYFFSDDMSFPYGVHLATVEVDVETGAVAIDRYLVAYDVGRAINPMLVEGQIVGGFAQGLGGALLEDLAYDADGQLVAGSFMDYLLPSAGEVPTPDVLVTEDAPTPLTPLGAKGAGEGGTTAAGAAIANAVADALAATITELPLSPARVVALAGGQETS
jgi:CO/xanthine dehydrogenase Mo-binding subunit